MEKLDRIHYLKHYQGCQALVLDPGNFKSGIIETVDLEGEGSVLIKQGEQSNWVEPAMVNPGLKYFRDLNMEDLNTFLDNILYNGQKLNHKQFELELRHDSVICLTYLPKANMRLFIRSDWGILFQEKEENIVTFPTNIPALIFLLCELGYDVCRVFGE